MAKPYTDYEEYLTQQLQDVEFAASYLNACLNDSPKSFLIALRDVAVAKRVSRIAKDSKLGRQSLYRTLTAKGNPRWDTLNRILAAAGLRISIQSAARKKTRRPR